MQPEPVVVVQEAGWNLRQSPLSGRRCVTAHLCPLLSAVHLQVRAMPQDRVQLSQELAGRHAAVGRQQLERLDTCYRALAAAAQKVCLAPVPAASGHLQQCAVSSCTAGGERVVMRSGSCCAAGDAATFLNGITEDEEEEHHPQRTLCITGDLLMAACSMLLTRNRRHLVEILSAPMLSNRKTLQPAPRVGINKAPRSVRPAAADTDRSPCCLQEGAAAQEQSLRAAVSSYFDRSLPGPGGHPVPCCPAIAWAQVLPWFLCREQSDPL